MPDVIQIRLQPLGFIRSVQPGTSLQDILFPQGVEFPCGGRGRCKGCRIKVVRGKLPVTDDDARLLSRKEIDDGWRLACRGAVESDLTLEVAQWEPMILSDDLPFAFHPRSGLGVVLDLGTTTLVGQLLDLQTGQVLAVRTALNVQGQHGADIMSRIDFALKDGQERLQKMIRVQIGALIADLLMATPERAEELSEVVLVGNTVMHHLFCGVDVEPLSHVPFEPIDAGQHVFQSKELGWSLDLNPAKPKSLISQVAVRFLPCLGGFVGSDILAGILATRLHESADLAGLVDLGTNGEIVIGNRDHLLCTSTAAGPAFEGARISMGMRATTGAISEVVLLNHQWQCRVLGQGKPRGICGSGLVDAVAAGLETGRIEPSGKLSNGRSLPLTEAVCLTQGDIRELQLAKGAIAAGIRILLQQWGASSESLTHLYLAGAFGNYINRQSAQRIGLLDFPIQKIEPVGNTALRGAKIALLAAEESDRSYQSLRSKIRHVSLHDDVRFQETFVGELGFKDFSFGSRVAI